MQTSAHYLSYKDTGYFSPLVNDYLSGDEKLRCWYDYTPDENGIGEAIEARSNFPVNRELLSDTLKRQYKNLSKTAAVEQNLELLSQENTFTICTAHQPNLLTGYLYFVYKILHAIKLTADLKKTFPEKNFVPVYYMGSEDNDLEELGTFNYGGETFSWDGDGQKGAVGRMNTKTLKPLLEKLFKITGPPGKIAGDLTEILTAAYLKHETIAEATQYLVNELFGSYGLVVLNPDEADFKKEMLPILKDDLLTHTPQQIVSKQIMEVEKKYKTQAHPRAINLFYLDEQLRERIEKTGDHYTVVNSNIKWNEEELLNELNKHTEKFSPNVIIRGLLQERILPNVAFIGGGAEVAYWLELKELFHHYQVFYPVVLLRQSLLWINAESTVLRQKIQLSVADIFQQQETLFKKNVEENSSSDWHLNAESATFENLFVAIKEKANKLDTTLNKSSEASLTRIRKQLQKLEQKMYKAEKNKHTIALKRIQKLKESLFPKNSLQERTENFLSWYLQYGHAYFDEILKQIQPLRNQFLIIEE